MLKKKCCPLPYEGDAAIMMVLSKCRALPMVPLIILMMTIAANYLQW